MAAIVVGSLLVFGLVGVQVWIRSEPLPPAPYDEMRDLGPLPPPTDNGMVVIATAPEHMFAELGCPAEEELILAQEGAPSLAMVEASRAQIQAWSVPDSVRERIDAALLRPRFAFECEIDPQGEPCAVLDWYDAHRTAVALALRDGVTGFDDEALARARQILIADRSVIVDARNVLQAMIAAINAGAAIELVGVISVLVASRDGSAISSDASTQLDALEDALRALDPPSWSFERAVIGEAIWSRRVAEILAPDGRARWGLPAAVRIFDRYYEDVLAYARDPRNAPRPVAPDPDVFSQTFEPYGALGLVSVGDLAPRVEDYQEAARRAAERTEVVLVALAAARARVASARASGH